MRRVIAIPVVVTAVLGGLVQLTSPGSAQGLSGKPITLVVGTSAGGIVDVATRLYADVVARNIGQSFIIDNRPVGAGVVAAMAVAHAKPDGHTLLVFPGSQMATVPAMQSVSYDPLKDFAPVTILFNSAAIMAVPAASPVKSVPELLAHGKSKPGGLLFGSQGVGTPPHLFVEMLAAATRTPFVVVQYRGAAPMMSDLVGGRLDLGTPSYPAASGFFADGRLRPLAVDADKRIPVLPDVPTLEEVGIKEKSPSWFAVAAPAGTPPDVVGWLNHAFVQASRDPELIQRLQQNGIIVSTTTPDQMARMMKQEIETMRPLVQKLGLELK